MYSELHCSYRISNRHTVTTSYSPSFIIIKSNVQDVVILYARKNVYGMNPSWFRKWRTRNGENRPFWQFFNTNSTWKEWHNREHAKTVPNRGSLPVHFSFLISPHAYIVDLIQSDVIRRIPPIMTVSCVYSSPSQSEKVLYNVLSCILSPTISTLQLRAFVCYRGVHYICFCKEFSSDNESSVWVEYNDCRKKYFSSHSSLIQYCIETFSLPVLLLFSKVRWRRDGWLCWRDDL